MTLLLNEEQVSEYLDMKEVIKEVERVFIEKSKGSVDNCSRTRSYTESSVLNVMHASLNYLKRSGVKSYIVTKQRYMFVILLYDTEKGDLLAIMAADTLGRFRTGAASAVATKYLYGKEKFNFCLVGSGKQALTQQIAMHSIFKIGKSTVWSPNRENLISFVKQAKEKGLDLSPANSLEEAVKECDVLTTITSSRNPFISPAHIANVQHINACGSNYPERAEIMPECFKLFSTVAVDSIEQAKVESGDLIAANKSGLLRWEEVVELSSIIKHGQKKGGKTLFKSNGVAMEDVAVANLVYEKIMKGGNYEKFEFSP